MSRHGATGYAYWGCRCNVCRAAMAAIRAASIQRVKERGLQLHHHGTRHGYEGLGCRCEDCCEAERAHQREKRARRKAAAAAAPPP